MSRPTAAPQTVFNVIVQGDGSENAGSVARHVATVAANPDATLSENALEADLDAKSRKILRTQITGRLSPIDGVSAQLTGEQIRALVDGGDAIPSITPDAPVARDGSGWSSKQLWAEAFRVRRNWDDDAKKAARRQFCPRCVDALVSVVNRNDGSVPVASPTLAAVS